MIFSASIQSVLSRGIAPAGGSPLADTSGQVFLAMMAQVVSDVPNVAAGTDVPEAASGADALPQPNPVEEAGPAVSGTVDGAWAMRTHPLPPAPGAIVSQPDPVVAGDAGKTWLLDDATGADRESRMPLVPTLSASAGPVTRAEPDWGEPAPDPHIGFRHDVLPLPSPAGLAPGQQDQRPADKVPGLQGELPHGLTARAVQDSESGLPAPPKAAEDRVPVVPRGMEPSTQIGPENRVAPAAPWSIDLARRDDSGPATENEVASMNTNRAAGAGVAAVRPGIDPLPPSEAPFVAQEPRARSEPGSSGQVTYPDPDRVTQIEARPPESWRTRNEGVPLAPAAPYLRPEPAASPFVFISNPGDDMPLPERGGNARKADLDVKTVRGAEAWSNVPVALPARDRLAATDAAPADAAVPTSMDAAVPAGFDSGARHASLPVAATPFSPPPASAPLHAPPAPAPMIAQVVEFVRTAELPGAVELSLSPDELGKVRVTLLPDGDILRVSLVVERPETLDLLRRHADQLAQEFRQAGFAGSSLDFAQGGAETFGRQAAREGSSAWTDPEPAESATPRPEFDRRRSVGTESLDLRL